jgi:undecaprenyl diphosphate synthase
MNRINGHKKGIETVRDVISYCRETGIRYLTLYTFSKENWNRPQAEVKVLMGFLESHLRAEMKSMVDQGIRFKAIGSIDELPDNVKDAIADVERATAGNSGMTLQLALSYSGREEIVFAAKRLARLAADGAINPDAITEETFQKYLYTSGVPDPDLLIRTSGESRISNFLLWQIAYTEIYITDILWPDFTRDDLAEAIRDFQKRERRFGLTGEQMLGVAG